MILMGWKPASVVDSLLYEFLPRMPECGSCAENKICQTWISGDKHQLFGWASAWVKGMVEGLWRALTGFSHWNFRFLPSGPGGLFLFSLGPLLCGELLLSQLTKILYASIFPTRMQISRLSGNLDWKLRCCLLLVASWLMLTRCAGDCVAWDHSHSGAFCARRGLAVDRVNPCDMCGSVMGKHGSPSNIFFQ